MRLTDADGMRLTCFATIHRAADHRARAPSPAVGPGRGSHPGRATGLRNLPLHRTAQNRIWLEIVQIALELLAWMPMLALTGKARLWEPRRLRLRLFTAAGQLVTTGGTFASPGTGPGPATSSPLLNGSRSCRTRLTKLLPVPTTTTQHAEQRNWRHPRGDTSASALPSLSPPRENGPPTPSADRHETS